MGQMLSAPVTDKDTTSAQTARLKYGASSMQGWRVSIRRRMEDAHTTELEVDGHKDVSFFAVFDGHGGQTIAQYAGRNAHHRVLSDIEFTRGNYAQALRNAFLGIDEDLRRHPDHANDRSGCTAVTLLVTKDNRLFCANAGDSRCVLSRGGAAIPLSFDHKPDNESLGRALETRSAEEQRIVRAGGYIYGGRVNGNLALSRAIGDFAFKTNPTLPPEEQMVTVNPDVIEETISEEDEFVILACDGIWDCMTNQQAVNFVRSRIAEGIPLGIICEQLMDRCLAPSGEGGLGAGSDNMTVIIVGLLMGRSDEALRVRCSLPARAALSSEVTGQSEADAALTSEPGQRRVFFGTSARTTATTMNGGVTYVEEESGMAATVESPAPAKPMRIPARQALELLLGFNLSGSGSTSSNTSAAPVDMEEDDDSVQVDSTAGVRPPASGDADLR